MSTKAKTNTPTPTTETPEKKYRKVENLPSGEWVVENVTTGEKKPASEFGDVTTENTSWT